MNEVVIHRLIPTDDFKKKALRVTLDNTTQTF